ncbi:hypothetical protein, partial [Burkholderia ambifaria]|uniref:hypothetical protein n=1 Tax=Burkholderia ambifaria TaxID=152480 RepID=UPI001E4D32CC
GLVPKCRTSSRLRKQIDGREVQHREVLGVRYRAVNEKSIELGRRQVVPFGKMREILPPLGHLLIPAGSLRMPSFSQNRADSIPECCSDFTDHPASKLQVTNAHAASTSTSKWSLPSK